MIYLRSLMRGILSAATITLLCALILAGCSYDLIPTPNEIRVPGVPGALSVYRNVASNPYREQLIDCTEDLCSLRDLPFIGMESTTPTIEMLLNRLVVTHDWMGRRFEEVLRMSDERTQQAILQLSRSITAVMIGADIRPSHYIFSNSIIFLDPRRLALTAEEASVINNEPDYRSNFGRDLQFIGVWRYTTSDNEYLYRSGLEGRTMEDIANYLNRLLFHELAHANDFYPHHIISAISCENASPRCDLTPYANYAMWGLSHRLSRNFGVADPSENDFHLHNRDMQAYIRVRYRGNLATDKQKAISGEEIAEQFESDEANHEYAYHTPYEDVAMLVEAVLVKYLFDADMDVGYINRSSPGETISSITSGSTSIAWGARGRIGDPAVKRRAQRIMDLMLPGFIPESFFDTLEPSRAMQTECGWIDNLDLSCAPEILGSITGERGDLAPSTQYNLEFDTLNPHQ